MSSCSGFLVTRTRAWGQLPPSLQEEVLPPCRVAAPVSKKLFLALKTGKVKQVSPTSRINLFCKCTPPPPICLEHQGPCCVLGRAHHCHAIKMDGTTSVFSKCEACRAHVHSCGLHDALVAQARMHGGQEWFPGVLTLSSGWDSWLILNNDLMEK